MKAESDRAEPLLLDKKGLAHRYTVSVRLVDNWVKEGWLPVIKLSERCHRFPVKEADRLIMAHTDRRSLREEVASS